MNLTKDQKESLKSLAKHPGWAVLKRIEEDHRISLAEQFLSADIDVEAIRTSLREQQIYCKARRDFINLCEFNTSEVIEAVM